MQIPLKPLDFVSPKYDNTAFGIITEVSITQEVLTASIDWIGPNSNHKSAWWSASELTVLDNLPRILAIGLCHPFGNNKGIANKIFTKP